MNIFAVSNCTVECSQVLDDKRLQSAVKETAQLLSDTIHAWGEPEAEHVYKPFNPKHMCARWVQENLTHFIWTTNLLESLNLEYQYRRNKSHKSDNIRSFAETIIHRYGITNKGGRLPERWCNDTPYPSKPTFEAYHQTLFDKWYNDAKSGRPPKWTNRGAPSWA